MTSSSIQRTVYPDGLIRMQTFAERVGALSNEVDCPHQEVRYFRYRSLIGMLR